MDDTIFSLTYADSVPPLAKAARAGDLEKIKKLISKGSLPQTPDNRGWTAVHYCVAANQFEALKLILKLKSKNKKYLVNLTTWENVTPLLIAMKASKPSYEMVKMLLKAGADPNQYTLTKLTPLHLACLKKESIAFVKLLLKFGANVNVQEDLNLCTPLHFAVCESCDLELVKYLLIMSNLGLKNTHFRTAFLEACNTNFLEAVKLFLEKDKSLANCKLDIPAIAYAGLAGNFEMVQLLINSGADVNCRCKAIVSCKTCDSDLILLDRENFFPIHSSLKNIEVFKLLLKLTKASELLKLETNYYSFSLFVMIYGGEVFFETLLQSDLPNELKTFESDVLVRFILCYPDMIDIVIEKFPAILRYCFALEPQKVFRCFVSQISKDQLSKSFKFLYTMAQVGISSGNEFLSKNNVMNNLESFLSVWKNPEHLDIIRLTCKLLSQSVLTLKQYCRIVIRRQIRISSQSDWLAFKTVKNSNLPDGLKCFLLFESYSFQQFCEYQSVHACHIKSMHALSSRNSVSLVNRCLYSNNIQCRKLLVK